MTITTTSTDWRDTIRGRYQDTDTYRYYSLYSSYDGFAQIWILKQATNTKGKKVYFCYYGNTKQSNKNTCQCCDWNKSQ